MSRTRSPSIVMHEQTTLQELLIYYLIGFIGTLYLAMLCGAAWLPDTGIGDYLNNLYQFVFIEHHFIVGFTSATPKFIAVFEAVWTIGYLYVQTQIKHPFRGREHGDAKWGDPKAFTKQYQNNDKKNEVVINFGDVKYEGVYTVNTHNYWLADGVYVNIDNKLTSNLNILIVGPPGTGKSFRVARPILSQLAGCFLVTDPKGELSKQTGQFFEDNDYEVLVLNVESEEGMENSIHFNPFRYLRTESDILSMAQILFKATSDPDASSNDAFFEQSAEVLMTDILYLMHYTYEEERKDWEHFVELLESTAVKADKNSRGIDLSDEKGIYNRFKKADENWRNGLYTNGEKQKDHLKGWVDIEKFYTGAQETTSSIVASLDAHCRYMKLQCVQDLLSEDDIQIRNTFGYCRKNDSSPIGSQKAILYIVTSEDKRYYDWITSMVYSMFFEELYHITGNDERLHETLPYHLTFLMDEFNNITLPESFVDKLSTMRSRNMSSIVIVQNLKQLKNKYPKNDMDKAFVGYMSFIDILGAPDWDSCKELSEMFGNMTIHKQTTGLTRGSQGSFSENEDVMEMPLFSPKQMFDMSKDGPCAMLIKGTDPLFVPKVQFQDSPLLPLLTRKKPYIPQKRIKLESARYDPNRSECEQIPECLFGQAAEEELDRFIAQGGHVLNLSDEDIDAVNVLNRHREPANDETVSAKHFSEMIQKNAIRVKKEEAKNSLDWDIFEGREIFVAQRLKNSGFSLAQIKELIPIIKEGESYDEIVMYFNAELSTVELSEYVTRLMNARRKEKMKNEKISK